jgi:hypothetical protein
MGFLTNFFTNVLDAEAQANELGEKQAAASSFEEISEEELERHLRVDRYGDFKLTDAIRPSYDLKVVPRTGYRQEYYTDQESGAKVPVLMASASREKLFEVFLDLIEPLGNVVDVVLETSHERDRAAAEELYREHIDVPGLKSVLYDFEDMLMNDGCSGLAVLNPSIPSEVQFDEHKLLIVYGNDLAQFEGVLQAHGINRDDEMKFITEAEHVHSSCDGYVSRFDELKTELGMDSIYA